MDTSMIATAIAAAAKGAIKVENTPEPPKNDSQKNDVYDSPIIGEYYDKPSLYLDTKDFSGVKDLSGGDKVTLCIECLVQNTDYEERVDESGKKTEKSSARLQILSIANISDFIKNK